MVCGTISFLSQSAPGLLNELLVAHNELKDRAQNCLRYIGAVRWKSEPISTDRSRILDEYQRVGGYLSIAILLRI